MVVIHSMTHATILMVITVYVLFFLALKRHPLYPFKAAGLIVHELFTNRKYLLHFAAMIVILVFNKIEISLENSMKQQSDFTPSFFHLEGNWLSVIQRLFENDLLTAALTFVYVVVFPVLMIASIGIYTYERDYKLVYAVCYGLMFNYMIAIPFYLLFPVTEVHAFNPHVRFLMLDAFPTFENEYRPLSDLDNCFPSLHTSISVTMALIALKSKNRFWKYFVPACAVTIVFSIFYLGVHWLTDMLGGLVLAFIAARLSLRIAEGRAIFGGALLSSKKRNMDS